MARPYGECQINGCHIAPRRGELLCDNHAAEWHTHPSTILSDFIAQKNVAPKCKISSCQQQTCAESANLCEGHRGQWHRTEFTKDVDYIESVNRNIAAADAHSNARFWFKGEPIENLAGEWRVENVSADKLDAVAAFFGVAREAAKRGDTVTVEMTKVGEVENAKITTGHERAEYAKEATMSSLKEDLKVDATDAGYRLAGKQFVKLTREPLIALIAGNGADETTRAKVAAFLATDVGKALVETLLSLGLSMVPEYHAQELARELRVEAMTDVGDAVADLLMGPLRQVVSMYVKGSEVAALPAATVNVKVPSFVNVEESVGVK